MKIVYFTFLESVFNNGIFDSQVKTYLMMLKKKFGSQLDILLIANMPFMNITRHGLVFNFLKNNKIKKDFLIQEFTANHIEFKLIPIYFPFLQRWGFFLNILLLPIIITVSFPLIFLAIMKFKPDIIHCRSYTPTLIALLIKYFFYKKIKIIFDMRGLYPEEGIVHKRWGENSFSYKIWKRLELILLRKSDRVVVLSQTFKDYIAFLIQSQKSKIEIIPASVDTNVFTSYKSRQSILSERLGLNAKKVFIYHGGLGSWHSPDLLAKVYKHIKEKIPDTHLLVLTSYNHDELCKIFQGCGLLKTDFSITWVNHNDIPDYLSSASYAIIPAVPLELKPNTPIKVIYDTMMGLKVSECLSMGLPIIANQNIGGLKHILSEHELGITFSVEALNEVPLKLREMEARYEEISKNCISFARNVLNIETNTDYYFNIYRQLEQ
jgi:glycosyltransferase involved in cell wall biosynthesis